MRNNLLLTFCDVQDGAAAALTTKRPISVPVCRKRRSSVDVGKALLPFILPPYFSFVLLLEKCLHEAKKTE